jgi:UDP-2,3-diacylglucosamine hydrolase
MAASDPLPKLGIVAGGGVLPAHLIDACLASGREFFVLALEGHTDPAPLTGRPHAWIRLGQGGKGIALMHEAGCRELVFAGPVRRPSLAELRPDARTARIFARLGRAWIGDDSLLSAVVQEMEKEGFRVVGADDLLEDFLAAEGLYGRHEPDSSARRDIERGIGVLRAVGALDIGQAVIVQQGIVLGIEAAEGTDGLIRRCRTLHREGPGGVLVKLRKPGQERRIDLPAIGASTVALSAESGLAGIAIEAGSALVFDRERVRSIADERRLFVTGIAVPE